MMKNVICAVLLLIVSFAASAQERTLRVDYIFSGTDKCAEIALDELSSFDGWAGRRVNLGKVPVRGNGQICMTDAQSGDTLYRMPFSTLFQEWQTTEEATRVRKSFENVFLLPMPAATAKVNVHLYDFFGNTVASLDHIVDPSDILIRHINSVRNVSGSEFVGAAYVEDDVIGLLLHHDHRFCHADLAVGVCLGLG